MKKMALYDAKDYFDITTAEDGSQKVLLKSGEAIDWGIVESVEVADGKVKIKLPDRAKAMEKYGKFVMEAEDETEEFEVVFLDGSDA